jgi:hypothetical protein
MPISINVNVDKIDKERFFKGKKGRYMDLILFETPESEFGDYMVKQRAAKGEKMPILGNGKYFKPKNGPSKPKKDPDNEGANVDDDW